MTKATTRTKEQTAPPARNFPTALIVILILAAFGPYLVGSIRVEQAVVYGLLLLSMPFVLKNFNPISGLNFFLWWAFYIAVAMVGAIFPPLTMPFPSGSLLAGLDNLLLPLAIMVLVWTFVPREEAYRLVKLACKFIAGLMFINAIIAILSTSIDLSPVLKFFWTSGESGGSVAERAEAIGRYSGIFNQPVEVGMMYSIAGIASIYVWRTRPIFTVCILSVIIIGGLISVSKIFILAGLPTIIFYLIWSFKGVQKVLVFVTVLLIVFGISLSGFFSAWDGADYLLRLFIPRQDQDVISLYSAGRFNEGATFWEHFWMALNTSFFGGVGASGWKIPYDGALLEFAVMGGVLGLLSLLVILLSLLTLSFKFEMGDPLRIFSLLFAAQVIAANFGFSPLTANRTSTVVWTLIALIALAVYKKNNSVAKTNITTDGSDPQWGYPRVVDTQ